MVSPEINPQQKLWVGNPRQVGPRSFKVYFGVVGDGGKHWSRNASSLPEAEELKKSIELGRIPEGRKPLGLRAEIVRRRVKGEKVPAIAKALGISGGHVYHELKKAGYEALPRERYGCVWRDVTGGNWMVTWWVGDTQYTRTSRSADGAVAEALREKWTQEKFIPPPTRIKRKKGEGCAWKPKQGGNYQLEWGDNRTTSYTKDEKIANVLLYHIASNNLTLRAARKFLILSAKARGVRSLRSGPVPLEKLKLRAVAAGNGIGKRGSVKKELFRKAAEAYASLPPSVRSWPNVAKKLTPADWRKDPIAAGARLRQGAEYHYANLLPSNERKAR